MAQQTALLYEAKHAPYVLGKRPIPTPAAGELLVKVHAAGLNPVDWKLQTYGVVVENFPAVVGLDASGEVEQVGEGVEGWSKGDRVFFQGDYSNIDLGAFQQYNLVPAEIAGKIPENITYSQAATVPATFNTSVIGLWAPKPIGAGLEPSFDGKPRYAGQSALVIGGGASTGQYAIQLLRLSGFSPIVTYASSHHTDYLKSLGATHVIDRKATPLSDLASAVKKLVSEPFNIALDTVGTGEAQQAGYDSISSGGQLITLLPVNIEHPAEDNKHVLFSLGSVHPLGQYRDFGKLVFQHLPKLLDDGAIKPNRLEVLPGGLGGIVGGLERLKKNSVSGLKLIAHPQET